MYIFYVFFVLFDDFFYNISSNKLIVITILFSTKKPKFFKKKVIGIIKEQNLFIYNYQHKKAEPLNLNIEFYQFPFTFFKAAFIFE